MLIARMIMIVLLSAAIGVAGTVLYLRNSIATIPQPAFHEHADFAMFLNGERFDFSKPEYMSTTPCKVTLASGVIPAALAHEGGDSLEDDVHLHDGIGSVVHSHAPHIAWHDLFHSLGMRFTDSLFIDDQGNRYENNEERSFRFFVNGKEVESIAEREIRDLDRVLISYGSRDRAEADFFAELAAISDDACYYSETCPHRGTAPYESCGGIQSEPPFLLKYLGIM